jgi:hypothetical protein
MTKNSLTVRIFTEDGLYRLDVDETLSCIDFKRKVEERCQLSSEQVLYIFLDSKCEKVKHSHVTIVKKYYSFAFSGVAVHFQCFR